MCLTGCPVWLDHNTGEGANSGDSIPITNLCQLGARNTYTVPGIPVISHQRPRLAARAFGASARASCSALCIYVLLAR
jgi:hypothetical protein